jgi:dipeptidyl aminopeptidase/acylaminoacyl peptidase
MRGLFKIAAIALVIAATAANAQTDAAAFGAREMVSQASLSPDGKSVALVEPLLEAQASALFVAPLDGSAPPRPIFSAAGRPERLQGCGWVSNSRLICTVFLTVDNGAMRLAFRRLVAVGIDGKAQEISPPLARTALDDSQDGGQIVDWLAGDESASVLMTRRYGEQFSTGNLLATTQRGLGVEQVNTSTLERRLVEPAREDVYAYISDQRGAIRIMALQAKTNTGFNKALLRYFYRLRGEKTWLPLGSYDDDNHTGVQVTAVDPDLNAAYGFEWINGHQAVTRISLDGSLKREVVVARSDVDVDSLARIGRQRRVVGASFATDRRETVTFDPALQTLSLALTKALPGQPSLSFVDASLDEKRLLFWSRSDIDAGQLYLFDKTTKQVGEVATARPQLSGYELSSTRPVTYNAADGTPIPAYLTLPAGGGKAVGAIVMPHGGPAARDEGGFDWLAQFFAARGYAVLQPNFRGSAGYGEAWFEKNGFQSWRTAIGDVTDGGRWLLSEHIAPEGKLAIVGWSYGGYAALQSSVVTPDLFKAVVAIAPVTDLETLRGEFRNFTNYKIIDNFIGRGPHVTEGSPAQNAEKIRAPVLLFHGDQDINVGVGESRIMLSRLQGARKKADLVVFSGLDHGLDDAAARSALLERSDAFIRAALAIP